MKYPLYIHHEPGKAFGGTFPDLPGVFTAADTFDDLAHAAQEAVELAFEGEDVEVPRPTDPFQWLDHPDYQGGAWLLVDIDLSKVNTSAMRLNISLPSNLVQRIDRHAQAHGMTRSGFLATAATTVLEQSIPTTVILGRNPAPFEAEIQRLEHEGAIRRHREQPFANMAIESDQGWYIVYGPRLECQGVEESLDNGYHATWGGYGATLDHVRALADMQAIRLRRAGVRVLGVQPTGVWKKSVA